MKKKLVLLFVFLFMIAMVAVPSLVSAQGTTGSGPDSCKTINGTPEAGTIKGFICKINSILAFLLPLLLSLGVVYFVWGVVQYVIASDEEAKKTGRNRMIYGIIGLAVIVGLWGLVKIVSNTFGLNDNKENINYPTVPY